MGAARSRFVPLLSCKTPCRPASTQVGCVGRSSAIGKAAAPLGAATFASLRLASSHPLALLQGGRCDSEGSTHSDDASEPPDFLALVFIAEELGSSSVEAPVDLHSVRWRQAARRWCEHPLAACGRRRRKALITLLLQGCRCRVRLQGLPVRLTCRSNIRTQSCNAGTETGPLTRWTMSTRVERRERGRARHPNLAL